MNTEIKSQTKNKVLPIWFLLLGIKIIISFYLPLISDEAYYWVWSKNMQLSYFDHPPFVSWLFYLGTLFEGWGHLTRLPAILLAHSCLLVWYFILKDQLHRLHWFYLLIFFSPLLGVGSLIVTPDLPIIFFWSLSTLLFIRILKFGHILDYTLLGASLGLGFCSKYHVVLFPLFCVLYLTFEKKWGLIQFKKIWALFFAGLVFSSPVIVWNVLNGFQSFAFQFKHGLGRNHWKPEWTAGYVLGQIFAVFPIPFFMALKNYFKYKPQINISMTPLHFYLGFGPLVFFFLTSFKGVVEANWPDVGFYSIYALFFLTTENSKWIFKTILSWIFIYIFIYIQYNYKITNLNIDKLKEPFKYQKLIPHLPKYSPVFGGTYQMSSMLWYLTKEPFYKLRGFNRFDFFDTIQDSFQIPDKFYLIRDMYADIPAWLVYSHHIKSVDKIDNEFEVLEFKKK